MEKVTKNARIANLESKLVVMQTQINSLIASAHDSTKRLIALEPDNPFHGKFYEPSEPKLKQLDQSVFDGLDEKWRFAAVDASGEVWCSTHKTQPSTSGTHLSHELKADSMQVNGYCDASDWQNSLIEREKVELTGSDLCRAMLERGDRYVMCAVDDGADVISGTYEDGSLVSINDAYKVAIPINNQGEPLTAADVGL